jgi:hypothetical protein
MPQQVEPGERETGRKKETDRKDTINENEKNKKIVEKVLGDSFSQRRE